jgi:hypothetical protein
MEKQDLIPFGIALLKYLSIAVGSVSGVIGLFVEFKNKRTNKITRNGYIILILIISSGLISALLQTLELYKEKKDNQKSALRALAQSQQNNDILRNINRTLNPIKDVYLSYWFEIPTVDPYIKAYTDRIFKDWQAVQKNPVKSLNAYGIYVSQTDGRAAKRIDIAANSPFFPSPATEKAVFTALRYLDITVSFVKRPATGKFGQNPRSDLKFPFVSTGITTAGGIGQHRLEFDVKTKKLYLSTYNIYCDPTSWEKTGLILGTTDLPDSRLTVALLNTMQTADRGTDHAIRAIRSTFKLKTMLFNMSAGTQFWIRENKWKRIDPYGGELSAYAFDIPSGQEALNSLR